MHPLPVVHHCAHHCAHFASASSRFLRVPAALVLQVQGAEAHCAVLTCCSGQSGQAAVGVHLEISAWPKQCADPSQPAYHLCCVCADEGSTKSPALLLPPWLQGPRLRRLQQ